MRTTTTRARIRGSKMLAPLLLLLLVLLVLAAIAVPGWAGIPTTRRVSVSSTSAEGNDLSDNPSISADGRFVAFTSFASNLVGGDTNGAGDVFVRDRETGTITLVSVNSAGAEGDGNSYGPVISADGRFVAFVSDASNLVGDDTNRNTDVFVRDLETGTTTRVNVSSAGVEVNPNDLSSNPSISADGRFVAFWSDASNLVGGDTNGTGDVFVRDRETGTTTRVSVSSAGVEGNNESSDPSISADGRFVAFVSDASNLIGRDTNSTVDVFVHDRRNRTTTRVSVSSAGVGGNDASSQPSISPRGRFVAFASLASNLVAGDTNGGCFRCHTYDVFVRDRRNHTTTRVSVSSAGIEGNNGSYDPSISPGGGFVAFDSDASNLVGGDTNGVTDVFVRGRETGTTTRVSVSSAGIEGNDISDGPSISAAGRFVAFGSLASNLVGGDTNAAVDVFVRGPLR